MTCISTIIYLKAVSAKFSKRRKNNLKDNVQTYFFCPVATSNRLLRILKMSQKLAKKDYYKKDFKATITC